MGIGVDDRYPKELLGTARCSSSRVIIAIVAHHPISEKPQIARHFLNEALKAPHHCTLYAPQAQSAGTELIEVGWCRNHDIPHAQRTVGTDKH